LKTNHAKKIVALTCASLKNLEKFEVEKPIDFDFNKTNYNL
jgi:hypothetical protein